MARATVTKQVSTRGSITFKEGLKGFVVAIGTAAAANLYSIFMAGQLPSMEQLKAAGIAGLSMGCLYVVNKFYKGPRKKG
jgi:hypothetical protein